MFHNPMMTGQNVSPESIPSPETGVPSLAQIDEQIAQHQAVIDQLIEIRNMLMAGALQRRAGGQPGGFPTQFGQTGTPIQPNPALRGY